MKKDTFLELNYTNYKDHIKKDLILIDFWAEWCSACIAQDRYYEDLNKTFNSKLKIGKIDVGDNRFVADIFKVKNIPCLILMNNGVEIVRMEGIESKEYLYKIIEKEILVNEKQNTTH